MKDLDYQELSKMSKEEILSFYKTREDGLSTKEVRKRLEEYGENIPKENDKKGILYFILESFKDKFILILLVLATVDYITGDRLGTLIIIIIAFISAMIRFVQDYSTYKFNEQLKEKIKIFTDVIRNNKQQEIRQEKVVLGDIITLSAGSVVPGDLYLFESKDLFINQSVFTGEGIAVEKKAKVSNRAQEITDLPNICLMSSNVISGSGKGIVIKTGLNTFIGKMSKRETNKSVPKTPFEEGMARITNLLIRYMFVISIL